MYGENSCHDLIPNSHIYIPDYFNNAVVSIFENELRIQVQSEEIKANTVFALF